MTRELNWMELQISQFSIEWGYGENILCGMCPFLLYTLSGRLCERPDRSALQWRHNERIGVLNHQSHDCLLNRLFKAQIKENIKAPCHWPLCGEFTGDGWILRTKGQLCRKCFHLMTSSCIALRIGSSYPWPRLFHSETRVFSVRDRAYMQ